MTYREKNRLLFDVLLVAASIAFAVWLVRSNVINHLLVYAGEVKYIESFVAGMFFTSVFTTPVAIVVLGEISQHSSPLTAAFFGSLGALVGDLVLFTFIKDRVSGDLLALIGKKGRGRLFHIAERRLFRWFSPLIAAFIIASPLPDELGVMFLGFAKTRTPVFMLFSLVANFLGILVIGLLAAAVA